MANHVPQISHKDICIPFVITDKDGARDRFEAVRFLKDGEEFVTLEEACGRAVKRVVASDADWALIRDDHSKLPGERLQFVWLITKGPSPNNPGGISCLLDRDGRAWDGDWDDLHYHCIHKGLVLRRSA